MTFLFLGALAGLLSGLFGVGGGVVLVPLLLAVGVPIHQAVGTSLAFVATVALYGVFQHRRHADLPNIPWSLIGAAMLGAAIGGYLSGLLPDKALSWLFATIVGLSAWRLTVKPNVREAEPHAAAFPVIGGLSGLLGGVMGVGGGFILVPLLNGAGVALADAVKMSLMTVVAVGLTGAIPHALNGRVDWTVVPWLVVGGLPAIRLGAWALHRLPERRLRPVFVVFLCAVAVWVALR